MLSRHAPQLTAPHKILSYSLQVKVVQLVLPFSKGGAIDVHGSRVNLFPDVRDIITNIQECGILMAAASRYVCPPSLSPSA